jgi:hypothetical protein
MIFSPQQGPFDQLRTRITGAMDEWTRPLPIRPHNKREHEKFHHGPHYILFPRDFAMQKTAELIDGLAARNPMESFRKFVFELFAEHTRLDGKLRWVNKTPAYVLALPPLKAIFPEMRFIHCVRDGRDTACSAMTRSWGPKSVPEAASWWVANVQQGVAFGQKFPEQCLIVRYEDVIRTPEKALGRMLDWLGEPGDPKAILENYQSGSVRLEQSRIGEWRSNFTDDQKQVFWNSAGRMLELLGYEK